MTFSKRTEPSGTAAPSASSATSHTGPPTKSFWEISNSGRLESRRNVSRIPNDVRDYWKSISEAKTLAAP